MIVAWADVPLKPVVPPKVRYANERFAVQEDSADDRVKLGAQVKVGDAQKDIGHGGCELDDDFVESLPVGCP